MIVVFITHLHALQVEYSSIMRTRENEEWLMVQCQSDEFYHNMKHHSALCDQIAQTQREFVLLHAMRNVIQKSDVCGVHSCVELLEHGAEFTMRQGAYVLFILCALVVLMPTICLPLWRRQMNVLADRRHGYLYNDPYGAQHYQATEQTHTYKLD